MTYPLRYIVISVILLCTLACGATILPVSSEQKQEPMIYKADVMTYNVGTEPAVTAVTVKAWTVNIRDIAGDPTGKFARQGQTLYGYTSGEWFILVANGEEYGKVWLGCVNVESVYGCEAE